MMLVERSARVDAPIEAVWEVVQRPEHLPGWLSGVRQAEVLSGEGFGRRQRVRAASGAALDAEVIAYRAPTLIAWRERAEGAGARAEARTEIYVELTPEAESTSVRLIMVRWPDGLVRGALLRWGVRRVGADLEGSLARLTSLATLSSAGLIRADEAPTAILARVDDAPTAILAPVR
jgi:uncharacterized protein YndB with AHSA1/START domain